MLGARQILTVCAAALVLSALTSGPASASTTGWMVNGSLLSGSKALATTAAIDQDWKLSLSGITIECDGATLNSVSPEIKSPDKVTATSLEFTGCRSISENCTIASEELRTVPLTAEATSEGTLAAEARYGPQTKTILFTILWVGTNCALSGEVALTGHIKVLAPTGEDERTLQLINAITTEASGELQAEGSPAALAGSALMKLASGESWSFL